MKQDAQSLAAYALYLSKFVQAYQAEGIPVFGIFNQNEPEWCNNSYPQCCWQGSELSNFVNNYMGPQFKRDMLGTVIMHGPFYSANTGLILPALTDSVANSFVTGVGCQYDARNILQQLHQSYPRKRLYETENPCGGPWNDWNQGDGIWSEIQVFLSGWCSAYMHWNMVLDETGKSYWGWAQGSLITVNKTTKTVTYSPQFYAARHFGYYIKPGAYRIATSGSYTNTNAMAFRNPDGENILEVRNPNSATTVAINFNGQKIKPTIPANSFNTFRIAGTPLPSISAFSRIEAEAYTIESGVYDRSCSEGGSCLGLVSNGDFAVYHNIDFGTGAKSFEARIAASAAGGTIEVRLDSLKGTLAGSCTVTSTGSLTTWATVTGPIANAQGKHKLYLRFLGPTTTPNVFSLNWFDFSQTGTSVCEKQTRFGARNPSDGMIAMIGESSIPPEASGVVYSVTGKQIGTLRSGGGLKSFRNTGADAAHGVYLVR
jgi:glucosylceramidase